MGENWEGAGFAEVSHYEEKQHLRIEMALACVFGSLDMHGSYQRLRLFCKVIVCKSLPWVKGYKW